MKFRKKNAHNEDKGILIGRSTDTPSHIQYDPSITDPRHPPAGKTVPLMDLGSAVTGAVTAAARGDVDMTGQQQRIDEITADHGVGLLIGLVRFPPIPSEFPLEAGPADFGVEHVARIINTLSDSGFERGRARLELATIAFGRYGWTVTEAARAVLRYADRPDAALPDTPHSKAALHTVLLFGNENLDDVMDIIEHPRM